MKTAIMDIGSNSVRLLYGKQKPIKQILTTQLSEGLDATGALNADAVQRTLDAIVSLAESARAQGAERVCAFATEAVRAARNGDEFCALVRETSGIELEVIDGKTEAQCGFLGASGDFKGNHRGVLDIGGASVELVTDQGEYACSLPIGVVRLRERYSDFDQLDKALPKLLSGYGKVPRVERLIGIGGTPTTMIAIAQNMRTYDPDLVHGSSLSKADCDRVYGELRRLDPQEIMARYPSLVLRRAQVITYGAAVLTAMLAYLNADRVIVSERDNLEGYAALRGLD